METNERDGVYTKETETHYIDVIPMLFNWRVATTRKGRCYYERHWCYQGRGMRSFAAAVLAVDAWDGSDDTEPPGWNKNGQTGEWRETSLAEVEEGNDAEGRGDLHGTRGMRTGETR